VAVVLLCSACKRGANEVVVYTSVDQVGRSRQPGR